MKFALFRVAGFGLVRTGLLLACGVLISVGGGGCQDVPVHAGPSVQFTRVPHAGEGGPDKLDTIEGRVTGAGPEDRIVLYARWGPWWVQPRVDQPFTPIQSDATWRNATHFGTDYAAVLVDPSYQPRATTDNLEGQSGVLAIAVTRGRPPFWLTWWFVLFAIAAIACMMLVLLRLRVIAVTRQMNMRFEARLAERARIARELHDSLLQGFQGLMFRLQAARDMLPARPAEAIQAIETLLDRGDQVIAEGRSTVEDLRSPMPGNDIAEAITALGDELILTKPGAEPRFRVVVEGKPRDIDPILRDEIYRVAREGLRNAFTHSQAQQIEAEITFGGSDFVLRIRDDGVGVDPHVFDRGRRAGHWGLPGMRERAREFGGAVRVWTERGAGTEVELSIPASAVYAPSAVAPRFLSSRRKVPVKS
jgi:signal transduction histidine kinase